jgi:hypothetical protein
MMSDEITGAKVNSDKFDQVVSVYCPTGIEVTEKLTGFAPRLSALDGKRIGLLWNGKPNGDFFLDRVGDLLVSKYKNVQIIKFWKVDPARTAHADKKSKEALDYMAQSADLILADLGD